MVMRSPACFILRSVWMVTFFKVHLRIVGTRALRIASRRSPTRRFGAGQPASGHTGPLENISLSRRRATHIGAHRSARLHARAERLVVLGACLAPGDCAHQVVHVLLAL